MRILVFDDNETNRRAAQVQLKDYDLTVVGTYDEAQELLATSNFKFDVVLCDLLVPASEQAQERNSNLAGKKMPVGIFIGLLAAVKARVKYIAVFTDSDHHSHPASACFDVFNYHETTPTPFTVEGSKVIFSNGRNWVNQFDPNDLSKKLRYEEYSERSDTIRAKNWFACLKYLIG